MRDGAEYRETLRTDGRDVWILGNGKVEDVTRHAATRAMVDEYAAWYERHRDPAWLEVLTTAPDARGARRPLAFEIPASAADLRRLGRAISAVSFLSAGNVTHTPGYGALIALGMLENGRVMNAPAEQRGAIEDYHARLASTGRFLTYCSGGAPVGFRFRASPEARAALRVVRQDARGVVVSGKLAMHTSVPFADDVYVGAETPLPDGGLAHFIVTLAEPGVRIVARPAAARPPSGFRAPLSDRFDELDAMLWLDEVRVPRERMISIDPRRAAGGGRSTAAVHWLLWHQQIGWLARAEFTLGLALALTDALGTKDSEEVIERITDVVVDMQTIRSCLTAAELEPQATPGGFLVPGLLHLAAASLHNLRTRQRMSEILRGLGGSSLLMAPADTDLSDERVAKDLEEAFGGGGYTALQRAALLQLARDLVSSELDGRESAFELLANGGAPVWRRRIRAWFDRYDELANGVLRVLDLEMPPVRVQQVHAAALDAVRRLV